MESHWLRRAKGQLLPAKQESDVGKEARHYEFQSDIQADLGHVAPCCSEPEKRIDKGEIRVRIE